MPIYLFLNWMILFPHSLSLVNEYSSHYVESEVEALGSQVTHIGLLIYRVVEPVVKPSTLQRIVEVNE